MRVSDNVLGQFILVRVLNESDVRTAAVDGGGILCESDKRVFFFDGLVFYYYEKG